MNDLDSYWAPLCDLVSNLRCWVRVAWKEDASTQKGWWGQLLEIPAEGYLEASGGPTPISDVEWVEISTRRIRGGIAGRPRQLIDIKDEILAGLKETQLDWELRESTWMIVGILEEEPVQVVRIKRP